MGKPSPAPATLLLLWALSSLGEKPSPIPHLPRDHGITELQNPFSWKRPLRSSRRCFSCCKGSSILGKFIKMRRFRSEKDHAHPKSGLFPSPALGKTSTRSSRRGKPDPAVQEKTGPSSPTTTGQHTGAGNQLEPLHQSRLSQACGEPEQGGGRWMPSPEPINYSRELSCICPTSYLLGNCAAFPAAKAALFPRISAKP